MLLRRKTPCRDCKDRNESCHATCEKYKEFTDNLKKEQSSITNKKISERNFYKGISETKIKSLKRKAKKPR